MFVASNIKYLRSKLGLTQVELAKHLEKTSAAISDYEKGKSLPPLDVAFKISQFFGITIDELVGKNLQREEMLNSEELPINKEKKSSNQKDQLQTLRRINQLQEQRLIELEREIRERAPALARRLGLD